MTSVSKNVYIDKLDDIVNKYIDTYHSTIKLISANVKLSTYIDSSKEIDDQDLNIKSIILLEYQNIKTFLEKTMFQISFKKLMWLKKLKTLFR